MASPSMGSSFTPMQGDRLYAVVNPQFCFPYPVELHIDRKEKPFTDGNFVVTDVDGNVLLKVRGKFFTLHNRRIVMDAEDNPLLTLRDKTMSMHSRCKVFRGDSSNKKDLLFSVKKSSLFQLTTKLDVFLGHNKDNVDFKMECKWFDTSGNIYAGDSNIIVAQMKNKKDNFVVTVNPNVDYAFIVALLVILDGINHDLGTILDVATSLIGS